MFDDMIDVSFEADLLAFEAEEAALAALERAEVQRLTFEWAFLV